MRCGPSPVTAGGTHSSRRGFTLVELMVVIAIIASLAAVSMTVFIRSKSKAENIRALKNMEQIGSAMGNYMTENDHLPAFKDTGVSPKYSTSEPYTQASVLLSKLGLGEATSKTQYAEIFRPPGLKGDMLNGHKYWYDLVCFAMYNADYFATTKAYLPKGAMKDDEGQDVGPFGRFSGGDAPSAEGWTAAQLQAALSKFSREHNDRDADLSRVPAMLEINAQYPSRGGWPWPVPKKPLYGNQINVLYFDWHVGSVAPRYFYTE